MTKSANSSKIQEGAKHSLRKVIRVRKEDSAFVYFILESYEGITSYSTLDFKTGDPHRDLELRYPPDFASEVEGLLKRLGEMVYEITESADEHLHEGPRRVRD